ncbi:hypothetical protein ACO0K7_02240 [Undibacterium sp. Ji67W]|uniref:hypothetical protein n=1 Tax=Undibacterium sp. Ji67W TaxID=3413042 RepID=UPI003BF2EC7E
MENGKPQGIFPQILDVFSNFPGGTYELQLLQWRRALRFAKEGKGGIDAHLYMRYDPNRQNGWLDLGRLKLFPDGLESTVRTLLVRFPTVPRTSRAVGLIGAIDVNAAP